MHNSTFNPHQYFKSCKAAEEAESTAYLIREHILFLFCAYAQLAAALFSFKPLAVCCSYQNRKALNFNHSNNLSFPL